MHGIRYLCNRVHGLRIGGGIFPDGTIGFINAWFHGLDLTLLKPPGGRPLTLGQFFYGLAGVAATSFIVGTLFAAVYNLIRPSGQ